MARLEEVCEILDSKRVPITAKDRIAGPYPYYGANGVQDYVADYTWGGGCGRSNIGSNWTSVWGTTPQNQIAWQDWHGTGHTYTIYNGERVFRNVYGDNSKTQYRYRTRDKVYTYYFYKNENKESASYPSGSNISNIVEWVQYRAK